jgi:hypothetical protein
VVGIGSGAVLAGRYRLREQIAAGATGQVWRAEDMVLDRAVAVKVLLPQYAGHAEALARFQSEATHAARLAHPCVVQVYDYGVAALAGPPFLVMELVNGPSVAEISARGPREPGWVLGMVAQAAAGLAAAHAAGLVHRDIKPANLLAAPEGIVKITDFGIASVAGSQPLTQAGAVRGTVGYLAPERVAGEQATPASDLYSLGVVAWECLAGAPPFTGTPLEVAYAHAQRALPPLPGSVPAGIAALIAQLTAKDPAARPPSAAAVAAQASRLGGAMPGDAVPPHGAADAGRQARPAATMLLTGITLRGPAGRLGPARGWQRPGTLVPAAVGLAAVALAGVAIAATQDGADPQRATANRPADTAPSSPAPRMVRVDAAALDGRPAGAVLRQLSAAGLTASIVSMPDGHLPPGTVISVRPAGTVPVGSTVTVTAASTPPGQPHGHHGDSGANQNGD